MGERPGAPVTLCTNHCAPGDRRGDHQGAGAGLSRTARWRGGGGASASRSRASTRAPGKPFIWHMFQARPGGGASPVGRRLAGGRRVAGGRRHQVRQHRGDRGALPAVLPPPRVPARIAAATGSYRGGPGCVLELVAEIDEPARGNTAGDGVHYGACGILGGADGAAASLPAAFRQAASSARSRPRRPAIVSGQATCSTSSRAAAAAGAIRRSASRRHASATPSMRFV